MKNRWLDASLELTDSSDRAICFLWKEDIRIAALNVDACKVYPANESFWEHALDLKMNEQSGTTD